MRMTSKLLIEFLSRPPRACSNAIDFCRGKSPKECWDTCNRGDWMLWAAIMMGVDMKLVLTAICKCIRPVLAFIKDGEDRPRIAIETIEAHLRGEATIEEVRIAARAVDAARTVYAAARALDAAAYAIFYAARTVYAAAHTVDAARALDAARTVYAAATREEAYKIQANIVREVISYEVICAALVKKLQEAKPWPRRRCSTNERKCVCQGRTN